jgi:hypothetical protein
MSKQFNGVINEDIRDSVPDWGPYDQPKAPVGAPNVLYIVWDDVGFSALETLYRRGHTGLPQCQRAHSVRDSHHRRSPARAGL